MEPSSHISRRGIKEVIAVVHLMVLTARVQQQALGWALLAIVESAPLPKYCSRNDASLNQLSKVILRAECLAI